MRYLIAVVFLFISISNSALAESNVTFKNVLDIVSPNKSYGTNNSAASHECNKNQTLCKTGEYEIARRGCCSHHGGVCGCSDGRAVCCDGEFSPTCKCN